MSKLALAIAVSMCAALAAAAYAQTTAKASASKAEKSDAPPATTKAKSPAEDAKGKSAEEEDPEKIDWSKIDWRKRLTRMQYYITREAGTERPFHNQYWKVFAAGQYNCVGCGLPLFTSDTKFDAGCGWPSFDRVIAKNAVIEHEDNSLGMRRVEVRCRRCNAHLGHVFNDGPTETGLRYCMNSAAMKFDPAKKAGKKEAEKKAGTKADAAAKSDASATDVKAADAARE